MKKYRSFAGELINRISRNFFKGLLEAFSELPDCARVEGGPPN
jgi:hypothetical protein